MDKQHVLLYSTGNQIQHHVANNNGTEYEKVCVYIYVCVYVYNWIILLYSGNEYNIINQLYINKIIFCKKKKKKEKRLWLQKEIKNQAQFQGIYKGLGYLVWNNSTYRTSQYNPYCTE